MIRENDKRRGAAELREYQNLVNAAHPSNIGPWPLLNGWDLLLASFKGWHVAVFKDAPFTGMVGTHLQGLGELSEDAVGAIEITQENRDAVRTRLERHFNIEKRDAIVLYPPDGKIGSELQAMLRRHELALGLAMMKIFLSHKGSDKPLVRQFKDTLDLLGFSPWLDEDSMPAGTPLDRGILEGFHNSCAAVFFITPHFKDENYLATEVDYAISEKQKKGEKFAIITLVFGDGIARGEVPDLLRRYVWKEPKSELEALREIIRALPVHVGDVRWR